MFKKEKAPKSSRSPAASIFSVSPLSRPPTKSYDRNSYVLVMDTSVNVLKFMKMHLNRYFSHVVVSKTSSDACKWLKQKNFDLIIASAHAGRGSSADFLKKVSQNWRHVPMILTLNPGEDDVDPVAFDDILVVDSVTNPPELDMDHFHICIRRALNLGPSLKNLAEELPTKTGIGFSIYQVPPPGASDKVKNLVTEIRHRLSEEIAD